MAIDWYAIGGIILGIAGIGATIIISLTVYLKQGQEGKKLQTVVNSINTLNEKEKNRRDRHINWLIHHAVNVLLDSQTDFVELRETLNNFRRDQNEQNLSLLQIRARRLLNHLDEYTIPFVTSQIKDAFNYINDPWLTNHFLYEFPIIRRPCLSIIESQLFVGMTNFQGLLQIVELIDDAIDRIDRYITTIQEEA